MPFVLWICRCAQTLAGLGVAGVVVLRLLARGTGIADALCFRRWAFGCWATLFLAGPCLLALTAMQMSGLPLAHALSGEMLRPLLGGTDFGQAWKLREFVLAGLFVVGASTASKRRAFPPCVSLGLEVVTLGLICALLGSLVWTGHARMSAQSGWSFQFNALHVLAAGAWPGGLLPLGLLLARARHDPASLPAVALITRRFSRLSVLVVGALAFSGFVTACGLLGTFCALWTSFYGKLLLGKVAIFAIMLFFGFTNHRLIRAEAHPDPTQTLRHLTWNVVWETILAAGVLLVTEALATSAPPVF